MAIRNFWMEANVDGYANQLRGGPLRKDGGMRIELLARNNGNKEVVLNVYCFERDGKLVEKTSEVLLAIISINKGDLKYENCSNL